MMLGPAFGIVIGYIVTSVLIGQSFSWQFTIWVHAALNLTCALALCFVPNRYINIDCVLNEKKSLVARRLGRDRVDDESLITTDKNE